MTLSGYTGGSFKRTIGTSFKGFPYIRPYYRGSFKDSFWGRLYRNPLLNAKLWRTAVEASPLLPGPTSLLAFRAVPCLRWSGVVCLEVQG